MSRYLNFRDKMRYHNRKMYSCSTRRIFIYVIFLIIASRGCVYIWWWLEKLKMYFVRRYLFAITVSKLSSVKMYPLKSIATNNTKKPGDYCDPENCSSVFTRFFLFFFFLFSFFISKRSLFIISFYWSSWEKSNKKTILTHL